MLGDLDCEFSGGGEDQYSGSFSSEKLLQCRESKGGCFSRSCLSAANYIPAIKGNGNRFILNWGGFQVTHVMNRVKKFLSEV
jgi:hypothetical protein